MWSLYIYPCACANIRITSRMLTGISNDDLQIKVMSTRLNKQVAPKISNIWARWAGKVTLLMMTSVLLKGHLKETWSCAFRNLQLKLLSKPRKFHALFLLHLRFHGVYDRSYETCWWPGPCTRHEGQVAIEQDLYDNYWDRERVS